MKYQVLCDTTAIIGVMKQADKVTGELIESTIKFGKEAQAVNGGGRGGFRGGGGGGGGVGGMLRRKCRKAVAPAMRMRRASPQMA